MKNLQSHIRLWHQPGTTLAKLNNRGTSTKKRLIFKHEALHRRSTFSRTLQTRAQTTNSSSSSTVHIKEKTKNQKKNVKEKKTKNLKTYN